MPIDLHNQINHQLPNLIFLGYICLVLSINISLIASKQIFASGLTRYSIQIQRSVEQPFEARAILSPQPYPHAQVTRYMKEPPVHLPCMSP